MLIEIIVRGNTISWSSQFLDADDVPVGPSAVNLRVNYPTASGRSFSNITMSASDSSPPDGIYTAEWDSSVALKGRVYWSIRATSPSAADEGSFDLSANLGNPNPS